MKLAKKISKGIALCAALTIIGWGGVTSCSNSSSDNSNPEEEPTIDEDLPEGWTAITVGDIEKYDGQDGTVSYVVKKNNNGSITISHDAPMALYAGCSFKQNFGDNNTLYTKITNNSDVAATVEVQVSKAGTADNDYQPTPTVVAVYVDRIKQSGEVSYSVKCKVEPQKSVVIVNKFDLSKNPDTVTITLNSQEGVAGNVEKGEITVSGISMKKVTDDSELGNPVDGDGGNQTGGNQTGTGQGNGGGTDAGSGNGDGTGNGDNTGGATGGQGGDTGAGSGSEKDPETPPEESKETVIYKLDFSGAEPPAHNYITEQNNAKFVTNVGVQITGAWAEFAFVPKEMPNLKDATHIKVNFKCSDDAAFDATDKDNNKFMLGGYKYSEEEKKDTNISWTCFLNGATDEFPKDFKVIEKEIKWEQKYDAQGNPIDFANFDDIGGFKIWDCNFTSGTLTVQSVEFIKK